MAATSWLKTRQTRFTAYAAVYILVIAAIVVLANWLADRYNKSVDTTANKRFSLSDQTEKVVKGLKQDVHITYWAREGTFERARDLLGRYTTLSPKVKVDYVDPERNPQKARAAGIKSLGTIRVDTGGRQEEARTVSEEEVTGAIIRALKGTERTACFTTGSGEATLNDTGREGIDVLKQYVERQTYKTREINLLPKPEVPKDCSVVVVDRPTVNVPDAVVNALRTYVENGGSLLVMLTPPIEIQGQPVAENEALLKQLQGWGVTANRDMIVEASENAQLLGPEAPLVMSYGTHPIVNSMGRVATAMPLARSLEVKNGDKTTVEKLFSSTEDSLEATISGKQVRVDPKTAKKGPFALAAAGKYTGGPQGKQGRFVVVGSADWVSNTYLPFSANRSLFMNMLNWLSSDEDLISIRPKEPENRPLNMSQSQVRVVLYTSLITLPLLSLIAGIGVWWQRR